MKKIATCIVFFCTLFAGCVNERLEDWPSSVIVRGNQIQCAGRAVEEHKQFQPGDIVSFFSQAGIEAENVRLTYKDGIWEHGGALEWNASGEAATYTAYYPSFESGKWEYYDEDGFLKDIVYAHGEVSSGMFIELKFQHLFSKITFKVDEKLNEQIQSIAFTPSVQVKSIDPLTREVTLTETPASQFVIENQPDQTYLFFVPSADEVTIDIQITTSEGKQISSTTSSQSYESGYRYTYYLAPEERKPGIYTVEDFIAFTHLINGMSYQGKSLDEFGEEVNGRMTYYLRNDLQFTEKTSKEVLPIGFRRKYITNRDNYAFNDCFDGQEHTINGLQIITVDKTDSQGLFCSVDVQGVVKNLNMENCSYVNTNTAITQRVGIIAGWSEGTIMGCHVKSCKIENGEYGYAGGVVCDNLGSILNCTVDDMWFVGNEMRSGGLCYDNQKDIINCCVTRCHFIDNEAAGGLCCNLATNGLLLNSYVHSLDAGNSKLGAFFYQRKNYGGLIDNCYYPKDSGLDPVYNGASYTGTVYTYDSDFTVIDKGCSLQEALNAWVDDYQEKYPDYPLWRWQEGDGNIPFIPQTP